MIKEQIKNRGITTFVSPVPYMHYVEGHTHVAFNSNYGNFLNKLTFSLAHFGLVTTVMMAKKWLNIKEKITRKEIKEIILKNRTIYTISPSLFPRPDHWDKNLKVLGYHERSKNIEWQPGKDLLEFLERHEKVLFITFGSMTNPDPEGKTRVFIDILERNEIPAIINTAAGGLIKPDTYNSDLLHFVSNIPYDWIFEKIYGVVHHGGSGTTHLALKYGCPSMIIPHIIDQHVWSSIVSDIGAGPAGIKIGKVSAKNLEPKILDLITNTSYKKKAESLADQMSKEDYEEEVYTTIVED